MFVASLFLLLKFIIFCNSSKPTGGSSSSYQDNVVRSGRGNHRNLMVSSDWMCTICGCINFARRTSCFQVELLFYTIYSWLFSPLFEIVSFYGLTVNILICMFEY